MSAEEHRYFIIHKPYNMVSQFVSSDKVRLLGELDFDFPEGTHAIGRLDSHSEGLLILTTNKKVTRLLFESDTPHQRTYLVQVKNVISEEKVQQLREGVSILVENSMAYMTKPCEVRIVESPNNWAPGVTEIPREYPHTWLEINLVEGKFHQVRKMVAAVGHPCRRLIRVAIEDLSLGDLPAGGVREIEEHLFFHLLKIENYK